MNTLLVTIGIILSAAIAAFIVAVFAASMLERSGKPAIYDSLQPRWDAWCNMQVLLTFIVPTLSLLSIPASWIPDVVTYIANWFAVAICAAWLVWGFKICFSKDLNVLNYWHPPTPSEQVAIYSSVILVAHVVYKFAQPFDLAMFVLLAVGIILFAYNKIWHIKYTYSKI